MSRVVFRHTVWAGFAVVCTAALRVGAASVIFLAATPCLSQEPTPCVRTIERSCFTEALAWHVQQPIRGITVSTHRGGQEWADPAVVRPTLLAIRNAGASWVAFHPYAGIRADGTVTVRASSAQAEQVRVPLAEARRLGLKLMVKPHLAYWGSPFSWRGEITFHSEEQWQRFFSTYESWILQLARASAGADAFVVGTELDATVHRADEWRTLIEKVRGVQSAPLTFASNWPDYERVPFWQQLDAIGIQAYFPVSKQQGPTREQIAVFWRARMASLAALSRRVDRPVVFTELGYSRTWTAATQPWLGGEDEPEAEGLQTRLLEAALRAIEQEPTVLGSFLWKWFPEPRPLGRDFQTATPAVRQLLRKVWQAPPVAAGSNEARIRP